MYVDLHVHSVYSDGMLTPEQLAADAAAANVSLIALADHNTTAGNLPMQAACKAAGIACIDAVEIDTLYKGEDLHMLAYGCDREHPAFAAHVRHARRMLDKMTEDLVQALEKRGDPVSFKEYLAYPEQPGKGGWKGLHYLQAALKLPTLYHVLRLYGECGVTYANAGFRPAEETVRVIHEAGGVAVLAHPGDSVGHGMSLPEMTVWLEELFDLGLDGAECYYPKHTPEQTEAFAAICRRRGKLITSGSDCHGAFSGKPVGFMKKTENELILHILKKFLK